ncbi:MAG: hypothetical protein J6S83_07925 [Lachnospiraceae bacterium]|nr:hypothetical protein [Lachnospiraceae bacterium]
MQDREDMIRSDLFSFEFIKKSPFYGSFAGLRYRIAPRDKELEVCTYPEPFDFEHTDEAQKEYRTFPFTPEGYEQAGIWLEEKAEEHCRLSQDAPAGVL